MCLHSMCVCVFVFVCACVRARACVVRACLCVRMCPPSLRLSSMSRNSPILMICQSRPSTRWGLPSLRSWAPMFTTWQPIAEAEFRARFRFSCGRGGESETPCPLINITRVSVTHSEVSGHSALKCVDLLRVSVLCLHALLFVFVQNSFIYNLVRCVKRWPLRRLPLDTNSIM